MSKHNTKGSKTIWYDGKGYTVRQLRKLVEGVKPPTEEEVCKALNKDFKVSNVEYIDKKDGTAFLTFKGKKKHDFDVYVSYHIETKSIMVSDWITSNTMKMVIEFLRKRVE